MHQILVIVIRMQFQLELNMNISLQGDRQNTHVAHYRFVFDSAVLCMCYTAKAFSRHRQIPFHLVVHFSN